MNFEGGLDYRYAKSLPPAEITLLVDVINAQRKAEEQAIETAKGKM